MFCSWNGCALLIQKMYWSILYRKTSLIHFTLFCLKTITFHSFLMFCAGIRKKLGWSDLQNIFFGGLNSVFIIIWPTETDSRIRGQKPLLKCGKSWKEQLKNMLSKKRAFTTFWLFFTLLNYSEIYSAIFNHDLGKFNQEIFLILLDKIMARSYQDVQRIFLLSRSW